MSTQTSGNSRKNKGSKKNRKARRALLNKRLAAYSAMAAGVVAGSGSESADAALMIHDINQTTPLNGILFIDVDAGVVSSATLGGASNFEINHYFYSDPGVSYSYYGLLRVDVMNNGNNSAIAEPSAAIFRAKRFATSQYVGGGDDHEF